MAKRQLQVLVAAAGLVEVGMGGIAPHGAREASWRPEWTGATQLVEQGWAKRCVDLVGSLVLLLLLSPFMVAIAIMVKLTSRGSILYRWRVVGRGGRPFVSYKFRTMVENADELKADLLSHNEMRGPVFKMARDPRVTQTGRWLRRFSLDELPQLWSVLIGDMSLVGPRPPLQSEYVQFAEWQKRKLSVTPGITCLWQVHGRNRIRDFDEWVKMDLEYVDNWSLWLDLKILLQTAAAVIGGTGS